MRGHILDSEAGCIVCQTGECLPLTHISYMVCIRAPQGILVQCTTAIPILHIYNQYITNTGYTYSMYKLYDIHCPGDYINSTLNITTLYMILLYTHHMHGEVLQRAEDKTGIQVLTYSSVLRQSFCICESVDLIPKCMNCLKISILMLDSYLYHLLKIPFI